MEVAMVLALSSPLAHISCCLRDSFHSLQTKLSREKQALRRAHSPPSKKSLSPSLPFSSAEGVAMTTFWRLNSIFETDL